jgi:hypothetical protein
MQELSFIYFIQWSFYALIAYFAYDIVQSIKSMQNSVQELNLKLAVVIKDSENHKEILEKLDDRIYNLERK